MTVSLDSALELAGDATGLVNGALDAYGRIRKLYKRDDAPGDASKELIDLVKLLSETTVTLAQLKAELERLKVQQESVDEIKERKRNYVLSETDVGARIYRLKEDAETGEPPHEVCPACFSQDKIAILQPGATVLFCNICEAMYDKAPAPRPEIVSDRFEP